MFCCFMASLSDFSLSVVFTAVGGMYCNTHTQTHTQRERKRDREREREIEREQEIIGTTLAIKSLYHAAWSK